MSLPPWTPSFHRKDILSTKSQNEPIAVPNSISKPNSSMIPMLHKKRLGACGIAEEDSACGPKDFESTASVKNKSSPAKLARFHSPATMTLAVCREKENSRDALANSILQSSPAARRLSFAPTNKPSQIATPPLRRNVDRVSAMASAYGIRTEAISNRKQPQSVSNSPSQSSSRPTRQSKITVAVRKRPLSSKEAQNGPDVIEIPPGQQQVHLGVSRTKLDGLSRYTETFSFAFDRVYDQSATNQLVYADLVRPLVRFACDGGSSTCFAYGQTGSGKTHTMFHESEGICYLAARELLRHASSSGSQLLMSFYEIYQGHLLDLLNNKKRVLACERRDGSVNILWLTETAIVDFEHFQGLLRKGLEARITGSTGANSKSSRSHAILNFTMANNQRNLGKFTFIDLAGSERGADRAETNHQTKLEGADINKSLLALKECIRAMDMDSSHLPFRQSKLTMVLRDSLIGNARTCMIATVSPAASNSEHSLNTLRYADRMKEVDGRLEEEMEVSSESTVNSKGWSVTIPKTSEALKTQILSPKSGAATDTLRRLSIIASAKTAVAKDHSHSSDLVKEKAIPSIVDEEADELAQRKQAMSQIRSLMETIWQKAVHTLDTDMLGVLKDELENLASAFTSLS